MPIYDFRCRFCQKEKEVIAPIHISTIGCDDCGSHMDRLMGAPASIRMDDGTRRKRRERIKEPVWRDTKTGKVESMY